MLLYKNNTRFKALVTVLVQSTENPAEALAIGAKVAPKKLPAEPSPPPIPAAKPRFDRDPRSRK